MAGLVAFILVFGLGLAALLAVAANDRPRLTRPERKELQNLRAMRDELFTQALDAAEVEPFAASQLDTIRKYERQIRS